MKSILVVCDVKDWAFDKIYKNLKNHLTDWNIDVWYAEIKEPQKNNYLSHKNFDLVLYLCDYNPQILVKMNIPREKVIFAIRSHVTHYFYKDITNLEKYATCVAASNKYLYDRFNIFSDITLLQGGVDTDFFTYKERISISRKPVVGFSASLLYFNREYRGVDILEEACKKVGFVFNPAIKEIRNRNQQEMLEYYHNEIDIYADISKFAGRQNPILESGACNIVPVASKAGISEELIISGYNGVIVDRNVDSVCEGLLLANKNKQEYGKNIRKTIENNWSWKVQSKLFESVFNRILDKNNAI